MRVLLVILTICVFGCGDEDEPIAPIVDTCPYPNFDIDWQGNGRYEHGIGEGELLLSNGYFGAIALADYEEGRYDVVMGGAVVSPTEIIVTHIAINRVKDGKITANEVVEDDTGNSRIALRPNNQFLKFQLGIPNSDGSIGYYTASVGCGFLTPLDTTPDVAERLTALATDLIAIMETN